MLNVSNERFTKKRPVSELSNANFNDTPLLVGKMYYWKNQSVTVTLQLVNLAALFTTFDYYV